VTAAADASHAHDEERSAATAHPISADKSGIEWIFLRASVRDRDCARLRAGRTLPAQFSRAVKSWPLKLALFLNFLVLAMLLNSVGAVALHVQRAHGVTASVAATLALYKSLGIAAASLGAAFFLRRIGYRRAMLVALAGLAGTCALVPSFPEMAMLRLLFAVAGLAFATIKVSVYATIGLIARNERDHASLMSLLESFFPIGIVLGNFLFGAFTNDADPSSPQWLTAFYVLAGLSAIAALLLATVGLDESATRESPRKSHTSQPSGARGFQVTPGFLWFGGCVFLYVMLEQSTLNWLPTFNADVLHLPARLSIQLASGLTIAVIAGRVAAGFALRRVRWFPLVLCCLGATGALVLLALQALPVASHNGSAPSVAFVLPLAGFFLAPIYPAINSAMLSHTPIAQQSRISSWGVLVSAAGSSTGTLVVGQIFEHYGGQRALLSALVPIAALMGALFLFDSRNTPKAEAD
jgi:FHS family glucose/mannose:H+ symporter-like MFS transporter